MTYRSHHRRQVSENNCTCIVLYYNNIILRSTRRRCQKVSKRNCYYYYYLRDKSDEKKNVRGGSGRYIITLVDRAFWSLLERFHVHAINAFPTPLDCWQFHCPYSTKFSKKPKKNFTNNAETCTVFLIFIQLSRR